MRSRHLELQHHGLTEISHAGVLGQGGRDAQPLDNGVTPLLVASRKGNVDVVRALIGADGIRVNQAADNGCTPLYNASQNRNEELLLLKHCKNHISQKQ